MVKAQRFVITGMGLINNLGIGVEDTFKKLFNRQQSTPIITKWNTRADKAMLVHRAFELADISVDHSAYTSTESRNWPLLTKAAAIAVQEAITQSNFDNTQNVVASLISTVSGGGDARNTVEFAYNSGKTKANPFQTLGISYDYSAGAITSKYGWNGPSTVMVSACATGLYNLDYGIKCIAAGDCDIAVVGATDTMVDKYNMYFFQVLHALTRRDEDTISQPFSDTRDGFVLGEGAAVLVVETLDHALARGANILAEVCSLGFYTETVHPTSPSDSGIGATASALIALKRSGIDKSQIGFINAHATSTQLGDVVEYNAMNSLFPDALITGYKGHIGHTMGASAITEMIYGIKSMQEKLITPVANFSSCNFEKDVKIVKETEVIDHRYFIKNSYGFGGKCASAIIGLYD